MKQSFKGAKVALSPNLPNSHHMGPSDCATLDPRSSLCLPWEHPGPCSKPLSYPLPPDKEAGFEYDCFPGGEGS